MYPILISLVILLLVFGLVYSLFKARRQASAPHHEQSDNPVNVIVWIYVIGVGLAIAGALIYAVIRL